MSSMNLLRVVGAVSLLAAAPTLIAATAYAQTAPPPPQTDTQASPPPEGSPSAPTGVTPDAPKAPSPSTTSPSPSPTPPSSAEATPSLMTPASSVQVGSPVYGADGEKLGQVEGVKAQANGGIEELHVKTGGFFGFWTKTVAVSGDKVANGGENVRLAVTSDEFRKLPTINDGTRS
jgi:hypothetical protein